MGQIKSIISIVLVLIVMGCGWDPVPASNANTIQPKDFLSATTYTQLFVEIQCISGFKPQQATLDNLKTFLEARLNKPGGITITTTADAINSLNKVSYSDDDLAGLAGSYRTQISVGTTAALYILFVDAPYAGTNSLVTLGIPFPTSGMFIFEKSIKENSGGANQPSLITLETTVVLHEVAHTLGLVNNGSTMQTAHEDTAHKAHCNVAGCLMGYTVDTAAITPGLATSGVPGLDAACLADLKANGGK